MAMQFSDEQLKDIRAAWKGTESAQQGSAPAGPEYEVDHYAGNAMTKLDFRLGLLGGELHKYPTLEALQQHVVEEVNWALAELEVIRAYVNLMPGTSPEPKFTTGSGTS